VISGILPVSGLAISLRPPTGFDDVYVLETQSDDIAVTIELANRLATPVGDKDGAFVSSGDAHAFDWSALTVTDLDVLILLIRKIVLGDKVRTDVVCPAPNCGRRVDFEMRVTEYVGHFAGGRPRRVEEAQSPGWYRFTGTDAVTFRLPTGMDLISVGWLADADRAIAQRCIRPSNVPAAVLNRVQLAMQVLAPSLREDIQAVCSECGSVFTVAFNPQRFCLTELRYQAALVYEDVHLLARTYHWREDDILAMQQSRRARYREMPR
jgi:hypothetical protein